MTANRIMILPASAILLLAACGGTTTTTTAANIHQSAVQATSHMGVAKFCDAGRLVYVYEGYKAGGIVVVDAAPECGQNPPQTEQP